jgi:hypothetical protein
MNVAVTDLLAMKETHVQHVTMTLVGANNAVVKVL